MNIYFYDKNVLVGATIYRNLSLPIPKVGDWVDFFDDRGHDYMGEVEKIVFVYPYRSGLDIDIYLINFHKVE